MRLTTTKTLAKVLQDYARKNEKTKDYKIYKTTMSERTFSLYVDIDTYNHDNDFDFVKDCYNVIVIEYPQDFYACNKYITTNDLTKIYNKMQEKTLDNFIKQFFDYIEI